MIGRASSSEPVGAKLLHSSGSSFAWWKRLQAGSVHRQTLRSYVTGQAPIVRSSLEKGSACGCRWTAKVCRKLLEAERSLGTFAAAEEVPTHNSAAERVLRHRVIWRKTSGGTDGHELAALIPGVRFRDLLRL